jgi:hypothetical protein
MQAFPAAAETATLRVNNPSGESRAPGALHVRVNAARELGDATVEQRNGTSSFALSFVFRIPIVITALVELIMYNDELHPDSAVSINDHPAIDTCPVRTSLGFWIKGYMILSLCLVTFNYYATRGLFRDANYRDRMANLLWKLSVVWFILGHLWVPPAVQLCSNAAPHIVNLALSILVLQYIEGLFPIFACCVLTPVFILFLPCILHVLVRMSKKNGKGASKKDIAKLQKTKYRSGMLGEGEEETCAICLCEFEDDEYVRTLKACNHTFHSACVDDWLLLNDSCPCCRAKVVGRDAAPTVANPESSPGAADTTEGNTTTEQNVSDVETGGLPVASAVDESASGAAIGGPRLPFRWVSPALASGRDLRIRGNSFASESSSSDDEEEVLLDSEVPAGVVRMV